MYIHDESCLSNVCYKITYIDNFNLPLVYLTYRYPWVGSFQHPHWCGLMNSPVAFASIS